MNYLISATLSYLLNSLSVLNDKFLLSESIPNPLTYVFYISVASLLVLLALPFTKTPSLNYFIFASISSVAWVIGAYFLFSAIKKGQADRVAPVIGILTPVFLIIYYFLVQHQITLNQVWGATISVLGLLVLVWPFLKERSETSINKWREFSLEILSALFFSISYATLKSAYSGASFLSVLVYSRLILIVLGIFLLVIPTLRKTVLAPQGGTKFNLLSKTGALFALGQLSGGLSQLLLLFSISLANPGLVNSLQGIQYIFLFIFSLILSKKLPEIYREKLTLKNITSKVFGILLIGLGLYILAFANNSPQKTMFGVTFSPRYAESLGLNSKATYVSILDDLSPQTIRLPIYWDEVEPNRGKFNFVNTDYYISEAQIHSSQLTLAVGYKVPRYPECFIPNWTAGLNKDQFNQSLYDEITQVVNRYKDLPNLHYWQVENEPYFSFGVCPKFDGNRLKEEVDLVKRLDPSHQVMVTESGEFSLWLHSAAIADIVGATLYRNAISPFIPQGFPEIKSPLPPFFYQLKQEMVSLFYPGKKVVAVELQAEPWALEPLQTADFGYLHKAFSPSDLGDNVDFAKQVGFDSVYLWGVEWWYFERNQNHPEYLNNAILIFKDIK